MDDVDKHREKEAKAGSLDLSKEPPFTMNPWPTSGKGISPVGSPGPGVVPLAEVGPKLRKQAEAANDLLAEAKSRQMTLIEIMEEWRDGKRKRER
jgi:hypothetical protein